MGIHAIIGLAILPGLCSAQVESSGEIGIYASVMAAKGGIRDIIDNRRGREIQTHIDDGFGSGFRAAYNFNRRFAMEGTFAGTTNNHLATLSDLGATPAITDTNALFFVHGNGVFHLLTGRIAPYLTAGLGILGTIENETLTFNYGGGLKIFTTRRLAIRLDARRYHANLEENLEERVLVSGPRLVPVPEPYKDRL
jgi:hypothetical protein